MITWSRLGEGSWKRFKKVARLLPESSLLISKRMEVMVTTWPHGHPNLFKLDHITCFTFYNQLLMYTVTKYYICFKIIIDTSLKHLHIYRSWRKVFLLTITSLSLTSPSHHSHHYLILVIIFKLKVLLETISPLVPPSPSLTAINVKMVTECNCSTPTLLQTHLKHVTPSFVTNTFGNNIQIKFDFLKGDFPCCGGFPAKLNSLIGTALWHCFVFSPKILVK